jgi:hypothetical protein
VPSTKASLFFLCFIFVVRFNGLSQNENEPMRGSVIDAKTKQAVPFASIKIWIRGRLYGVITNDAGDFQIPENYRSRVDSLVISSIGYTSRAIAVTQLIENQQNIILLTPSVLQLSEVAVKAKTGLSARRIVQSAIAKISKNYPEHPYSYVGYYRDYQMKEKQYYNLNEAIVGVWDKGFDSADYFTTKMKLYRYKENRVFDRDTIAAEPYGNTTDSKWTPSAKLSPFGGNELSILRIHDAIRNHKINTYSFVNRLDKDFVRNHVFKLEGTVFLNNTALYRITFHAWPSVSRQMHTVEGEIFIEHGNFAIHKLRYKVFKREVSKPLLLYDIQLEYTRREELMYLNYISVNNFFKVKIGFEVTGVVLDTTRYSIDITFNNEPNRTLCLSRANYDFHLAGKPLYINKVEMVKDDKRTVRVYLFENDHNAKKKDFSNINSRITINYHNLRDVSGMALNDIKYLSVYQFRELFLQKIVGSDEHVDDGYFISKELPLSKNNIEPASAGVSGYWMNTPLKKE